MADGTALREAGLAGSRRSFGSNFSIFLSVTPGHRSNGRIGHRVSAIRPRMPNLHISLYNSPRVVITMGAEYLYNRTVWKNAEVYTWCDCELTLRTPCASLDRCSPVHPSREEPPLTREHRKERTQPTESEIREESLQCCRPTIFINVSCFLVEEVMISYKKNIFHCQNS